MTTKKDFAFDGDDWNSTPVSSRNLVRRREFELLRLLAAEYDLMRDMEGDKDALLQSLINLVNEIASISDYAYSVKKQFCNLARRLKLLIPMFEEIRDGKETAPEETVKALVSLKEAIESAKELLRFGSEGSKIYQVLERDEIMNKLTEVTGRLEQALSETCYEKLDISDEIKEQVELVLGQFRRAIARVDPPDTELYHDILHLYNKNNDSAADRDIVRRLAEKLQLLGIADLTRESLALHELVAASSGDPGDRIEKMSIILKKIKDFVQTENLDIFQKEKGLAPSCSGQVFPIKNQNPPVVPDDFRCPISLELMKDPVIVSTGQTYDRYCIEKWLNAGYGTCPKTQQVLSRTTLTPNSVLRSLIKQWCEIHGIDPPASSQPKKTMSACSLAELNNIEILISKLSVGNPDEQMSAACEIRLLAKRNADNRVAIAEAGAIPLLVSLLSNSNSRTQEHAVTALLNLSIYEDNKRSIVTYSAIPGIVHVLKKGSMEARENAAATLFSLSVRDQNKITIGALGAIPPLVTLLSEGTQRGKKDAATALFNLCIYQGNKGKAVRAGVVPTLMRLLMEPGGGMMDEAMAVLAILATHPEGKAAIGAARAVPVLVEVIGNGSSRNRENAAAVLVHLISGDHCHLVEAKELGVMESLIDLAHNGTDRGKRKAAQLLERMSQFVEEQTQAEAQSQSQTASPTLTADS